MKLNLPQATSYIILQTAVISTKFEYLKTAGFGSIKELKSSHNAFQASVEEINIIYQKYRCQVVCE